MARQQSPEQTLAQMNVIAQQLKAIQPMSSAGKDQTTLAMQILLEAIRNEQTMLNAISRTTPVAAQHV